MDKYEEFKAKLAEANANKLPCIACDTLDNDWPERRGLCLDCYCAVTLSLPGPKDGTTREDIFLRMTRRDIVTIALYYLKVERERKRLQYLKGKINVDVPRQAGYNEVQRILEKYK
jgi:hypothetical protein